MRSQSLINGLDKAYQEGLEFKEKKDYARALLSFQEAMNVHKNELKALEDKSAESKDYEKIMDVGTKIAECKRLFSICALELGDPDISHVIPLAHFRRAQGYFNEQNYLAALQDCDSYLGHKTYRSSRGIPPQDCAIMELRTDTLYKLNRLVETISSDNEVWRRRRSLLEKAGQVVNEIIDSHDFDWKMSVSVMILDTRRYDETRMRSYFNAVENNKIHLQKLQLHCKNLIENCETKKQFDLYQGYVKSNKVVKAYDAFIKALEAIPYKALHDLFLPEMYSRHLDYYRTILHKEMMNLFFKFILDEKRNFFNKVIRRLEPEMQLRVINQFIDKDSVEVAFPVRSYYWVQRGEDSCHLTCGTLALLSEAKTELEKRVISPNADTNSNSNVVGATVASLGVFAEKQDIDNETEHYYDDDGLEMTILAKRT